MGYNYFGDKRLDKRYITMTKQSMQHSQRTSAGLSIPSSEQSGFATTQAVWRFFANEETTPQRLVEPLRQFAGQEIEHSGYVLHVFDWSKIGYKNHPSKIDLLSDPVKDSYGYDLTAQLVVDAVSGSPIAIVQAHLKTANGFLSTMPTAPQKDTSHLDQVLPMMEKTDTMNLGGTPVFIIDREADSVFYFRQWQQAGSLFLVRIDDDRRVDWQKKSVLIKDIKAFADAEQQWTKSRDIEFHGKSAEQYVFETNITLSRAARRNVKDKRFSVPGEPLSLRLVVTKVTYPQTGNELACWYLLSNTASDVSSATIALWYYYRWRIESYFKLLKSDGQEMAHWQQECGLAILKRLLVVSMGAAMVWNLQRNEHVEAQEFKQMLVRLSGKAQKRGRPPAAETLLSGLFVLMRLFDFLDAMDYDLTKINKWKTLLTNIPP
jgi:hypothetical protein